MSYTKDATSLLDRVSLTSGQQRVFRLTALLCAIVFLALVPLAGGVFHPLLTGAALLLALAAALMPESSAALLLTVMLGGLWALSVDRSLSVWVLVAAVDLFTLHMACTLASYGPSGLVLDRGLLRLWGRRYAFCVAAGAAVWLAGRVIDFLDLPGSGVMLGAALALVLVWVTVLTLRLVRPPT